MGNEVMLIVFGGVLLVMGVMFLVTKSKPAGKVSAQTSENKGTNDANAVQTNAIKKIEKPVEKHDMSEFIKFDKIANDMIYQNNGERYTMVIQCKGVNYHLMSEIEQMAVEEGFIMFLNTLKFPIQLYVQTKSINLSENIRGYKEKVREFADKQNEVSARYAEIEDDIDSTQEEIDYMKKEKLKYTNIAEYVYDITKYVERMALNKHMLQRDFYVIFSYNKSELATTEKFTQEEYEDLCYRELYTRAQAILGSLMSCSVTGRVLTSNEIAQLVYTSINKDDASLMPIKEALDSGMLRLYTTSEDIFKKRRDMIEQEFEEEGRKRVQEAVKQAMEKGLIVTKAESEESIQKEIDRRAIKIIDKSTVDDNTKQQLKNTIKENRRERLEKIEQAKREHAKAMKEQSELEGQHINEQTVTDTETDIEAKDDTDYNNTIQDTKVEEKQQMVNEDVLTDSTIQDDDDFIIDTKEGEKTDEE